MSYFFPALQDLVGAFTSGPATGGADHVLGFPVPGVHGAAPHRGDAGVPRAALRPGDLRGPGGLKMSKWVF